MRKITWLMLTLVTLAGCSNPKPVAQLDMSTYWYSSAVSAADASSHCQTSMTMSGGNKVKCN